MARTTRTTRKKSLPEPQREPPKLDDAAALLIQASPGDPADLLRAVESLAAAGQAMQAANAPGAPMLVAVVQQLRGALDKDEARISAAIADALMTLEAVMAIAGAAAHEAVLAAAASAAEAAGGEAVCTPAIPAAPRSVASAEAAIPGAEPVPAGPGVVHVPADADAELMESFVAESIEYLDSAEAALLVLESDPAHAEACNTVFRAFHTIKGTSAFLGLDALTEVAHAAESLLSRIRDREIRFGRAQADLSLRSIDLLKAHVGIVRATPAGGTASAPAAHGPLIEQLTQAALAGDDAAPDLHPAAGETVTQAANPQEDSGADVSGSTTSDAWMRVRTERLDRLVDIVGELVIAQSMIAQDDDVLSHERADLARKVGHASKIVRELQDLSMSMRMVPLRPTFQKMARLVRDVAHRTGRRVELLTAGDETEIDRSMVDLIADPLVHMIRNAVDHGIENIDDRRAAGKPDTGVLRLSAAHAGGNVVIELEDDGRGLDRRKIIARAIERGLVESEKGMTDSDVFNLIFAPGFSTAEQVTALSGRGVGMDVVRRNVEAMRGRIEISSTAGQGTRFTIRLPLTLAITDGMLVRVGRERYIVPTVHIHLSFRPEPQQVATVVGRGELIRLRDEMLPLIRLHRLFGATDAVEDPTRALLVVVGSTDRRCALLVDDLIAQQQVVAKPLGGALGAIPGVSGSAILGDGRVGLILDVAQVIDLAQRGFEARGEAA